MATKQGYKMNHPDDDNLLENSDFDNPLTAVGFVRKVSVRYCLSIGANCRARVGEILKFLKKSKHIAVALLCAISIPTSLLGKTVRLIINVKVISGVPPGYSDAS